MEMAADEAVVVVLLASECDSASQPCWSGTAKSVSKWSGRASKRVELAERLRLLCIVLLSEPKESCDRILPPGGLAILPDAVAGRREDEET
jgi:hypothetical protein